MQIMHDPIGTKACLHDKCAIHMPVCWITSEQVTQNRSMQAACCAPTHSRGKMGTM